MVIKKGNARGQQYEKEHILRCLSGFSACATVHKAEAHEGTNDVVLCHTSHFDNHAEMHEARYGRHCFTQASCCQNPTPRKAHPQHKTSFVQNCQVLALSSNHSHLGPREAVYGPGSHEVKRSHEGVSDAPLVRRVVVDERLDVALERHGVGLQSCPQNPFGT